MYKRQVQTSHIPFITMATGNNGIFSRITGDELGLIPGSRNALQEKMCIRDRLLAIVCTANIFAHDRVSKIRNKLLNRDESSVIVASHRGDWRNFPEMCIRDRL